MGGSIQIMCLFLVVTFAQLISFRLALSDGYPEKAGPVGPQRQQRADATGNENFTCTTTGRFPNPANCSQYYLCVLITPSYIYLSYMTCPNALVFDPVSQYCTTTDNYVCPSTTTTTTTTTETPNVCEGPGFFCNSDTTFTECADVGVPILIDQTCPAGYFCNTKCVAPCIDYVPLC